MSFSVERVYPQFVDELWHDAGPKLALAVPSGLEEMRRKLREGLYELWSIHSGRAYAVVDTVDEYEERMLVVRALAGSGIESWRRSLTDALKVRAREVGAEYIRCLAHNAKLADVLGRAGWQVYATVMEMGDDGNL